ncbi:heterodisulfide reductase-related iron-sulfur binding cluster [Hippea sp. KM1]|uniref:heterodisulfide reductase-related iron-sulfur binding cluster n=1 Tax=Hippea sp. KM1 TaxID=944481 RepID=UPI00046CB494|nr:heterodisulfide reductase-related iron-sulfur binding cluster [Hippea sp. KM1]
MNLLEEERRLTRDRFLKTALDRLRHNYFTKREKIESLYDLQKKRYVVRSLKERNIESLKDNLKDFLKKIKGSATEVRVVKDKEEALGFIDEILSREGVRDIVKSKSLTTEEIDLNSHLKERGFNVIETDLGEWLVQINDEPPTHMTAPAIHMSKERINELLRDRFGVDLPVDAKSMVDFCKLKIREGFSKAQCGIIGANVASIESGAFFILSNEGNIQNVIRQDVVICIIGIDKIVRTDKDAFDVVDLLPKAATAQITTSFIDILKRPFGRFYVVLLDNGRLKLSEDEQFKEILYCIHCGACQNACPVYTTVSGKLFRGKSYAGPVGVLLSFAASDTPDIRQVANMCIGCMACDEICSSRINIQHLILSIKARYTKDTPGIKGLIIKYLENDYRILRLGAYLSHFLFKKQLKTHIRSIDEALGLNFRALPGVKPSFDVSIKTSESSVCLFAGCSVNFLYPNIGQDAVSVADKLGVNLFVVKQKACCGAPAWYNGERVSAKKAVKINTEYLLSLGCEKILFLDPHCVHMIERDYVLLEGGKDTVELSKRVECASSFFIKRIKSMGVKVDRLGGFLGYHHPCHLKRGLNVSDMLEAFLRENEPNFVKIKDSDRCCGFAGSYSMMHPFVSESLLKEKMDSVVQSNIQLLITACPGCIMQIAGGFKNRGISIEILHFVSYLNRILTKF